MGNKELLERILKGRVSDESLKWLLKNGYTKAPCSKRHHLAERGGLLRHSVNVTECLLYLTDKLGLKWSREQSPYYIGMFHDLCKIDQYIYNPIKDCYEWNADQPLTGHGDKSIVLTEEYVVHLTEEERECIRWHMGAFDLEENWERYTNAVHKYPNVLWTHTADMMSTHIIEEDDE